GLLKYALHIGRKIGIQTKRRNGIFVEQQIKRGRRGVSVKGERTSGHLVEDCAEGKKVGTSVDCFSQSLLRGHVCDSAHGCSGTCQVLWIHFYCGEDIRFRRRVSRQAYLRQAEIKNLGVEALG